MTVTGIDHVAMTVADVETTVAWYARVLAAEPLHLDLWRGGQIPVVILQLGQSRLSVHDAGAPAQPCARTPTAGSADICFRWAGPIDDAVALLRGHGVDVEEGPVSRPASNGALGQSVYFRDPDQNLVELLSIDT